MSIVWHSAHNPDTLPEMGKQVLAKRRWKGEWAYRVARIAHILTVDGHDAPCWQAVPGDHRFEPNFWTELEGIKEDEYVVLGGKLTDED